MSTNENETPPDLPEIAPIPLPPPTTADVAADASIERDLGLAVKVCPGCRVSNLPTSQYCYRCGLKLPEQATIPGELVIPAGFWRRFASYIIDGIFLNITSNIIVVIVISLISAISHNFEQYSLSDLLLGTSLDYFPVWFWYVALGSFVLEMAYWTISVGWKGRSVGKLMLGMKVVRTDGSRVGYWRAFARFWAYQLCWLTLGLGFLAIAWNKQKRGLHDLICDTMVIKV